ncbi:hypothetical protein DYB37_007676 [Aphanomyces astaci]|uniref:Uncharacterized protein n=1 Tax=Aphanomyces astaci TaxID=112090 RepID=A0A418D3X5_APHAT|nr:hypothetical protein DYB35_002411 [Aphanomyces astaci]RHZ31305.1 hypothetical protein DYB37_007676 [Aphanomyces astaci]
MRTNGLIMTLRISLPGPHATAIMLTSDYIAFMLQYTKQHRATRIFAKVLRQLTKRQPYKQMLEVDMRKKKLTCSCLSMDFHILDMAGAALVGRVPSSQTFVLTLTIMDDDGTTR